MKLKNIEMYSTATCGYCRRAKQLLVEMGVTEITEHTMGVDGMNPVMVQEHIDRINPSFGAVTTVPQIIVDGVHIGGYTELAKYIDENKEKE